MVRVPDHRYGLHVFPLNLASMIPMASLGKGFKNLAPQHFIKENMALFPSFSGPNSSVIFTAQNNFSLGLQLLNQSVPHAKQE